MTTSPYTRPSPFLRSQDEIRAQRIALNVAGNGPEVFVALYRKRLVPALVNMTQSRISPVLLPSPNMGDRQTLHEPRKLSIALRPQQQVPVIRHHCRCTDPHRRFIKSLAQDLLERSIVRGLLEQLHSRDATIQDVKY
jgi:hypothetical protein